MDTDGTDFVVETAVSAAKVLWICAGGHAPLHQRSRIGECTRLGSPQVRTDSSRGELVIAPSRSRTFLGKRGYERLLRRGCRNQVAGAAAPLQRTLYAP